MLPYIAGAAALLISAGVARRRRLSAAKDRLKEQQFALIGPSWAGKTSLASWLAEGTLPAQALRRPTEKLEKKKGRTIELGDLHLRILPITDVPGGTGSRDDWLFEFRKATVVCYLFDAAQVLSGDKPDYETRLKGDWDFLRAELNRSEMITPRIFLIGTHEDRIEAVPSKDESIRDLVTSHPTVRSLIHMAGGRHRVTVIVGSMADDVVTESLATDLLSRVATR